jgi:DNA polymerase-3 subunit epsilon
MTREIVLDTETTGFDPETGDRIIEIGCVELINHMPSGKHLQLYINPERDVPAEAIAVHGITDAFFKDKPVFSQVYSDFIDFVGDSKMVIHNAEFDMKFINWELKKVGHDPYPWPRAIDTLAIARQKFPGSPANLDALCRRFGIDNTERTYHGALLDSELLAEVYLELLGGRQHGLSLASDGASDAKGGKSTQQASAQNASGGSQKKPMREPRQFDIPQDEQDAHTALMDKIKDPIWTKTGR